MSARPALAALAERAGILPSYVSMRTAGSAEGGVRLTSDATREALLAAMGLDASSEAAAQRTLRALDEAEGAHLLAPVRVETLGSAAGARVPLRWPALAGRAAWRLELHEESGRRSAREGRATPGRTRSLPLPPPREPGYHRVRLVVEAQGALHQAEQRFIACPARCVGVREVLGRSRGFGLLANLYALRQRADWGIGDLGHLRRLVRLAGAAGAAFIGMNPLHALRNRGLDVCPYSPLSRLFRNELLLEVTAVPELRACEEARRRLASPDFAARLERLRERPDVDYDGVHDAKREILLLLHRCFAARERDAQSARGGAYARYRRHEDPELTAFATFVALGEHLEARGEPPDWRRWPEAYRSPDSPAVAGFREEHGEAVDFHRWVQFELDRQLAAGARAAWWAGLGIGLYQDLALGASACGYDTWAAPDLYARGASAGAPPDDFSEVGQDWGLPPIVPWRLAERGYRDWSRLLRAGLAHAGALRIDHVMGLFRLWWLPEGARPGEGAYVRYPARDLLGILALESRRHGAVIVGEDLGTVPAALAASLASRGILSTRVLLFERKGADFRPAAAYSARALTTPTTHDLPPLAGFFAGRDLELRRAVGHIASDEALAEARRERERTCRALARRLGPGAQEDPAARAEAVARFLSRTPSPLVGFPLDDLAGEVEPVNLPGVPQELHRSWSRRMSVSLEDLPAQPAFRRAVAAVPRARRGRGGTS